MSTLIDSGPHTVLIYLETEGTDHRGNPVRRPADEPVVVTGCVMQPVASARGAFPASQVDQGQTVDATWRIMARNAPVGWWSRLEWVSEGVTRRFFVLGGPLRYTLSDGSTHVSATLQEER